jgi:hypothetical protein
MEPRREEPRREEPQAPKPRPEEKQKRFRLLQLETRIAPHGGLGRAENFESYSIE